MEDLVINFTDPRERANFRRMVDALEGPKRVTIKAYRRSRSGQQNRFLWGVVYQAFVEFRQEQGEEFTSELAHNFFGWKFLRMPVTDTNTGEIIGWAIQSTTKLNVEEFSIYVDKILAWLSDYGISVDTGGYNESGECCSTRRQHNEPIKEARHV